MMKILETIEQEVHSWLLEKFGEEAAAGTLQLEPTRKEFEGDYTLVVFPFVRSMRMKPEQAGKAMGEALVERVDAVASFNVIKGFLNLIFKDEYWSQALMQVMEDPHWLSAAKPSGTVLVEYSSPNTNKPLHLGHLRNIFLGDAVSNLKEFNGAGVVRTQIINDRGVHICKSMLAWRKFGNGETPASSGLKGDKLVGKYYVLFDQHLRAQVRELMDRGMDEEQAKKSAPLNLEVQEMLRLWEQGDSATMELWNTMNSWVYEGFEHTYKRMDVSFDKLYYESDTYLVGKEIVLRGLKEGVFYAKDDGSVWVDLSDEGLDHKLLMRADGTTVYMTQDIGTAAKRFEDYPNLQQVIYTVGDEQDYHFKVLFLVLQKMGYSWASACKHLSYGMVDLPSGKMKSREGTVVDADDLMEEVVEAARISSFEKGKLDDMGDDEQEDLFEMLGIGALKFYLLKVDPRKRMMFNPEESVSLNGDTGPMVQYTHARCKAVLRKAGEFQVGASVPVGEKERQLLRELMAFRTIAAAAGEENNPSLLTAYCVELARLYNQFYHDAPILKSEESLRAFRLAITKQCADTLAKAMTLLGIRVPERM